MEIDSIITSFKQFEISTTRFKDKSYVQVFPCSENILDLAFEPISVFEINYEKELQHLRSLYIYFYNFLSKVINEQLLKVENQEITLYDCNSRIYHEILYFIEQHNLELKCNTKNFGEITLYFISDFLEEIEGRIDDIDILFEQVKPYNNIEKASLVENILSESKIYELEGFTYADWIDIYLTPTHSDDLIQSNIIPLNHTKDYNTNFPIIRNITFNEAIKPDAKEEFEKWYERFCIDEPSTDKIEAVLFFKLMNRKGYFIRELKIKELFQVTIDRTNRKISLNYFKNNGRKKFEDWTDGKPEVPKFK